MPLISLRGPLARCPAPVFSNCSGRIRGYSGDDEGQTINDFNMLEGKEYEPLVKRSKIYFPRENFPLRTISYSTRRKTSPRGQRSSGTEIFPFALPKQLTLYTRLTPVFRHCL
jgi:hypothetical protein